MNKFFVLFKKEVKELLTPQIIVPFVAMMLIFFAIGNLIGSETKKQDKEITVAILDQDKSALSKDFVEVIKKSNFKVDYYSDKTIEETLSSVKSKKQRALVVFPSSMEENLSESKKQEIKIYSIFESLSLFNNIDSGKTSQIPVILSEYLSSQLIQSKIPQLDQSFLKYPISTNNYVVLKDSTANINPSSIVSYLYTQTMFVPIVLFLIITISAQMVAGTIASEKENKTLETLLSTPIDRKLIVAAKLLAAGTVSLLMAGLYLIGIQSYTSGITGQSAQNLQSPQLTQALSDLNLTLEVGDYAILGVCLFAGILVALSFAFIIGSFAEDMKSSQALITPIMILLLIPYLLTMLLDIDKLSLPLKIFIYAIPFTHTFTAMNNLLLQRYDLILYGIVYVATLIVISVYSASKIFTSDKILTMKLSFGKKESFKKLL